MAQSTGPRQDENRLRLLRAGDACAFERFVKQYQESVFLCCRMLGLNGTETEDIAAETFLTAYKKLNKYTRKAKLSTWLWKITYCKCVDHLRKTKRKRRLHAELSERTDRNYSVDAAIAIENKELTQLVWQAVEKLPCLWATAIVLFYREEKTILEIANIMKKRKNTVKTYLYRGRKRLKALLCGTIGESQ